jgi:DNA polymerase III subunit delta
VFYILHGEDSFGLSEELAGMRRKMGKHDPAMGDLNTTVLDGRRLDFAELRHVCDTMPFMFDRRLVIVHELLAGLKPKRRKQGPGQKEEDKAAGTGAFLDQLVEYLPHLPDTTYLVFAEKEPLPTSHPIVKVAQAVGKKRAHVREFKVPKDWELPGWIQQRAASMAGSLSSQATQMLAGLIGPDLRLLDLEIQKLLLYADGRQVVAEDVLALVSRAREVNVFDLVDSVGRRETDRALKLLHQMLDDYEAPLYLLAMLARQVRILIQVSELQAQFLGKPEIITRLKLHPYVVEKAMDQARNFEMSQLEAAHQRLLEADWAIKTGEQDEVLALDLLIVDLARA